MSGIKWFLISCVVLYMIIPKTEWRSSVIFLVSIGVGYLASVVSEEIK